MRALYLDTAAVAVHLLGDAAVERAWGGVSVLPDFEVGGLAAHLARSVLQVEWYLDAEIGEAEPITAPEYYAGLLGVTEPDSALNRGVRQRAEEVAAEGHAAVLGRTLAALGRLQARLPAEAGDRRVEALGRVLSLDEYLKTRLVELTVHMDDLALSLGLPRLCTRRRPLRLPSRPSSRWQPCAAGHSSSSAPCLAPSGKHPTSSESSERPGALLSRHPIGLPRHRWATGLRLLRPR